MYCGKCLRDNALVAELKKMGHEAVMVPMYLPLTLDEEDQSEGVPIFFSGIKVYLSQKSSVFRDAPSWLLNVLSSRRLLKWAAGRAAKTRADELGDITLSMLRGEEGNQARELEELIDWLKTKAKPDAICLSNALLVGMVRRLRSELGAPVVCMLQGEDGFLDSLPEPHRTQCWETLAERGAEADMFVAPSQYFGDLMRKRLGLPENKVRVIYNGINLEGYKPGPRSNRSAQPKSIGYFARMCREKGLDILVDAYILLRQRGLGKDVKLRIGGSCGPADEPLVNELRGKLQAAGLLGDVSFHPNLNRKTKIELLESLSVFSVPARYSEAFGLYLIEALAAGVPVVQPSSSAFAELVQASGGGVLCEPNNPESLSSALESLLTEPARAEALGEAGRKAVQERFTAPAMARAMLGMFQQSASTFRLREAVPA